jgi:hypothetical protein
MGVPQSQDFLRRPGVLLLTIVWTLLLAYFFANVEIQIEGANGWASSLPTWRIEHHWLLDVFWGGRPMTGYHAWVFPCIALFFHFPMLFTGQWSWRAEARAIGCSMLFWLAEDFLWFALNPAYGIAHLAPQWVPWHKRWWGPVPQDYWTFSVLIVVLLWLSWRKPHKHRYSE